MLQPHLRPVTFEEWHCKMCNELCRSLLYYNTGKRCYFDLSCPIWMMFNSILIELFLSSKFTMSLFIYTCVLYMCIVHVYCTCVLHMCIVHVYCTCVLYIELVFSIIKLSIYNIHVTIFLFTFVFLFNFFIFNWKFWKLFTLSNEI